MPEMPGWPQVEAPPGEADSERKSVQDIRQPGPFDSMDDGMITHVKIFFATDRAATIDTQIGTDFPAARSQGGLLNYGQCLISIPGVHKLGHLETPAWYRFEFRPDPKKHIVLESVTTSEEDIFYNDVRKQVENSPEKEAFVFVHGYNVSFKDAARRTGQLSTDLGFAGAAILYSWPSNGKFANYPADESEVIWTAPHLERFLAMLSKRSGAERIHLIAHSMGNRAVCDALKALSYFAPDTPERKVFHHVILAAPDIDADVFRQLADGLKRVSQTITLYASSKDKAIALSSRLHKNPRAGTLPLVLLPFLESIDASDVETDFLAHGYFAGNWPLLADIFELITADKPAASRFGLQTKRSTEGPYYAFKKA
jgi:esterase/lipase superfamily enzyme